MERGRCSGQVFAPLVRKGIPLLLSKQLRTKIHLAFYTIRGYPKDRNPAIRFLPALDRREAGAAQHQNQTNHQA